MPRSFSDISDPNACIFGSTIIGGKKRSDKKRVLGKFAYYRIHRFQCEIYKECDDKNKNFVLERFYYHSPLEGTIKTKLSGSIGLIEYVESSDYLETNSKKHPPKYGKHLSYFNAKGEHVVCHFDTKIPDIREPIRRDVATKEEVELANV